MNIQDAAKEFKPDESASLTEDRIKHIQAWMIEKGYDARDPAAHRLLAQVLGKRKVKQLRKGVFLTGGVGTGKTLWVEKFGPRPMFTAIDLTDIYQEDRQQLRHIISPPSYTVMPDGWANMTIDELGDEPTLNHFGTRVEVMSEVISARYTMFKRWGALTYVTSNLSLDEGPQSILSRYGLRGDSRFFDMFSVIPFNCKDQRKVNQ